MQNRDKIYSTIDALMDQLDQKRVVYASCFIILYGMFLAVIVTNPVIIQVVREPTERWIAALLLFGLFPICFIGVSLSELTKPSIGGGRYEYAPPTFTVMMIPIFFFAPTMMTFMLLTIIWLVIGLSIPLGLAAFGIIAIGDMFKANEDS